ncbi:MAG: hypothetical protein QNJ47_04190 [Nostocaceae cyanobacterium]|nr:hypothetical protein [Nostocaceae cyanobacterium]
MDIYLLFGFIALYSYGVWALLHAGNEINNFLKRHQKIIDEQVLEEYKSLVKRNMYMALVQIFVLVSGTIMGLIIMVRNGGAGLIILIIGNLSIIITAEGIRTLETKVRSLPCAEHLAKQYKRVNRVWVKQAFPHF